MSSNVPEAPTTTGVNKSKDKTVLIIILVVIFFVIVVPIIIGTILVIAVLGFVSDHFGDITIAEIFHNLQYVEEYGAPLTQREAEAVRNVVSQIENRTIQERSISLADCRYLERIAGYFTEDSISFCNEEYLSAATKRITVEDGPTRYELLLSGSPTCAVLGFNNALSSRGSLSIDKNYCADAAMDRIKIVDTNEELESASKVYLDKEKDKGVTVNIRQ